MPATWDFLLCDGGGAPLAEMTTAAGKQLKYLRNNFAEAQCVISHKDDAAAQIFAAIEHGPMPTMRAYRREPGDVSGTLRFNGYLAPFNETLDETQLLTLSFRSPFGRLLGDGTSGVGRFTGESVQAIEKEQQQVARALILLYGGVGSPIGTADPTLEVKYFETSFAGLGLGSSEADGILRSITYPRANVGQAIINLSATVPGFDFDETFVEEGETLALFNTYASQGESKPAAQFQYGPTTLANVARVQRSLSSPITVVRLLGANGLKSERESATAIAKWGKWYFQDQLGDATSQAVLDARAEAVLAKGANGPVKTITFTPDFGVSNCPHPWRDFWLGDTVPFFGLDGAFSEDTQVRVNEVALVVDENGYESVSIPDPAGSPEFPDALHSTVKVQA